MTIIYSLGVVFIGTALVMCLVGYRRHVPQREIPEGLRFVRE